MYQGKAYKDIPLAVPFVGVFVERGGELCLDRFGEPGTGNDDKGDDPNAAKEQMRVSYTFDNPMWPSIMSNNRAVDMVALQPLLARLDKMQSALDAHAEQSQRNIDSNAERLDRHEKYTERDMAEIHAKIQRVIDKNDERFGSHAEKLTLLEIRTKSVAATAAANLASNVSSVSPDRDIEV